MMKQPPLPLTWIVIRQYIRRASTPLSTESNAHFDPNTRITQYVANVSSFSTVLGHNPELFANTSVTHGSASRLSALATYGF
jgi:hypothetical protein